MPSHSKRYNVKPTVVEGKQWHLIAVWTEQNNVSGHIDEDIWISGELDDFVAEYKSGCANLDQSKSPMARGFMNGGYWFVVHWIRAACSGALRGRRRELF